VVGAWDEGGAPPYDTLMRTLDSVLCDGDLRTPESTSVLDEDERPMETASTCGRRDSGIR
jgi:hypothetical protein